MHGELREVVLEMLGERSLKDRVLFDPKAVRKLIDDDYKEDKNYIQARNFMANAYQSLFCIISDYIFDEILTVLLGRDGKSLPIGAAYKVSNLLKADQGAYG